MTEKSLFNDLKMGALPLVFPSPKIIALAQYIFYLNISICLNQICIEFKLNFLKIV